MSSPSQHWQALFPISSLVMIKGMLNLIVNWHQIAININIHITRSHQHLCFVYLLHFDHLPGVAQFPDELPAVFQHEVVCRVHYALLIAIYHVSLRVYHAVNFHDAHFELEHWQT